MVKFFVRRKFTILLTLALLNVVATPFLGRTVGMKLFVALTLTAVMIASVFTVSKGRKLTGALVLMFPCLIFLWWVQYTPGREMMLFSAVLQALFIAYMVLMILAEVFRAERVTLEVIAATLVVYLFLAFFFSKLYLVLELLYPGSFSLPATDTVHDPLVWEYFSLITLSTLGYGDILPVSARARIMAGGQAMVGQIYLAVLVARLVSLYGNTLKEDRGKNGHRLR